MSGLMNSLDVLNLPKPVELYPILPTSFGQLLNFDLLWMAFIPPYVLQSPSPYQENLELFIENKPSIHIYLFKDISLKGANS